MKRSVKLWYLAVLSIFVVSCTSDDDICDSGEGTPQLKLRFRTQSTGKLKTLDSLYLKVDYGNGPVEVIRKANVDSVLVPLRVDDAPYTDFYVKLNKTGDSSVIRVNYTTKSIYVSPACGIKRNYENVSTTLVKDQPVVQLTQDLNEISNENKTHLYLLF